MSTRPETTLYDVLRVPPGATQAQVERAYRRILDEMADPAVAPDPRREARVRKAYEILSDPARRDEYDASLHEGGEPEAKGGRAAALKWGGAAVVVLGVAAAAWFFLRGDDELERRAGATLSPAEVKAAALVAIGRVDRVDMSGRRTPLGMAVAVENGVMLAPCEGIVPGAQIVVHIAPRDIPAQLRRADTGIGLCKLTVSGGASWPLAMTGVEPRPGDGIYVASLGAQGEVVITPGEVEQVVRGTMGRAIEVTARAGPPMDGSPLLDVDGRVLAIALAGQHMMLPRGWLVDEPARRPPPVEGEAGPPTDMPEDPRLRNVPPERRKRLEEAFRPPPKMPEGL